MPSKKDSIQVLIGPIGLEDLTDYVPEGKWRRFLEEAFFPKFFPEKWEWETRIILEREQAIFKVPDDDFQLRIGINSIVQAD